MKVLLAILSCQRDLFLEQLQRDAFLARGILDYRFFHGVSNQRLPHDSVRLEVGDDFWSLPFKTQAMCRWALEQGYDYVFKADTDTYIRPERLIASDFESHDYTGYFSYDPGPGAYASGGSGYWLSARAMAVVAQATTIHLDSPNHQRCEPSTRGEDLQVCWALRDQNIHCAKDERYCLRYPGPQPMNNIITLHDVVVGDKKHRIPKAHFDWVRLGGAR